MSAGAEASAMFSLARIAQQDVRPQKIPRWRFVANRTRAKKLKLDEGTCATIPLTQFIDVYRVFCPVEGGQEPVPASSAVPGEGAGDQPPAPEPHPLDQGMGGAGDSCPRCGRWGTILIDPRNATISCSACADTRQFQEAHVDQTQIFNKSAIRPTQRFSYQRSNHFYQRLMRAQGKENAHIPQEIVDGVVREARIAGRDLESLTANDVERFLAMAQRNARPPPPGTNAVKYTKYYINKHLIRFMINGRLPLQFTEEQERVLQSMFVMVEEAFMKIKPPDRKNIILISYILFKMCEMMWWDAFLANFPLLVDDNNITKHDAIWRRICDYWGWPFYVTIRL